MTLKTKKNTEKIGGKCPSHYELGKRKVASKCPRCGTIHKINMLWIGRGMPRIFCSHCRSFANGSSEMALNIVKSAIRKGNTGSGALPLNDAKVGWLEGN